MKSKNASDKRKHQATNSDRGYNHEVSPESTGNGLNGSPLIKNKRLKTEIESSDDKFQQYLTIWVCENRQLDKRTSIKFIDEVCFEVLLEELCEIYHQSIEKAVLFILCDDNIWAEINVENDDAMLSKLGIKQHSTISLEEREPIVSSTHIDVPSADLNANSTGRICLIVTDICTNQEIEIECGENDTVNMLKERIFAQLPRDLDHRLVQLSVDSKFIDTIYDDKTLASLGVTSISSIKINMHRKLETEHIEQFAKGSGRCGLRNLGNTCYMNSALQCLSHVIPLTDYFLQHQNIEGDVALAYSDFIRNVWSNQTIFEPRQIKMALSNYIPEFADFNQEDAHEFITCLLNQLHIDLTQHQTTSIISQLFHGCANGITTCLACKYIRSTPNLITFIPVSLDKNKKKRQFVITFEPINPNTLTVETDACGSVKHLVQAFINELQVRLAFSTDRLFERVRLISADTDQELKIETPLNDILDTNIKVIIHNEILRKPQSFNDTNQSSFQLIDCIHDFVALETPETLWFCKGKCQRPVHAAKRMSFSLLPPVLIVQLRRFINENGRRRKLHTFVDFPMNGLNLGEFTVDQQTSTVYDLIAVANHIGASIDRGHYTAYARQLTDPKIWYSYDDAHVSRIEENDVVSRDAYLLVYVKRQ